MNESERRAYLEAAAENIQEALDTCCPDLHAAVAVDFALGLIEVEVLAALENGGDDA